MSSETIQKVALIGASGSIGSIILSALLNSQSFEVTILSRESSIASFSTGANVLKTSYSEAALIKALEGQDAVVSAVGATGFEEQKVFIDAAVKAGVKRFIPSEFSANTLSKAACELVSVFEAKKAVLEYLRTVESPGFSWTGLAAGPLFDWGFSSGFLGFDIQEKCAMIWDNGDVPFSTTNQEDLGKAVVSILRNSSETANQYLYVSTITTTQNNILASLRKYTGGEWTVKNVSTVGQIEDGRIRISQEDFTGTFALVQASFWGNVPGIRSDYSKEEKLSNELLGIADGKLDDIIETIISTKEN